jgi:hypothetical protein
VPIQGYLSVIDSYLSLGEQHHGHFVTLSACTEASGILEKI